MGIQFVKFTALTVQKSPLMENTTGPGAVPEKFVY